MIRLKKKRNKKTKIRPEVFSMEEKRKRASFPCVSNGKRRGAERRGERRGKGRKKRERRGREERRGKRRGRGRGGEGEPINLNLSFE